MNINLVRVREKLIETHNLLNEYEKLKHLQIYLNNHKDSSLAVRVGNNMDEVWMTDFRVETYNLLMNQIDKKLNRCCEQLLKKDGIKLNE